MSREIAVNAWYKTDIEGAASAQIKIDSFDSARITLTKPCGKKTILDMPRLFRKIASMDTVPVDIRLYPRELKRVADTISSWQQAATYGMGHGHHPKPTTLNCTF